MRKLSPTPKQNQRAKVSERIRIEAANLSRQRLQVPIDQQNNGESETLDPPVTIFTKSMAHDDYGIVNGNDFEAMIGEINQDGTNGSESPFLGTYTTMKPAKFDIPLHLGSYHTRKHEAVEENKVGGPRHWESPLSGHVYELEGPDSDAVAMPPAPKLGSAELTAEMAEVYAMALCRDIPFEDIETGDGILSTGQTVTDLLAELNKLSWNNQSIPLGGLLNPTLSDREKARRQSRFEKGENHLSLKSLFRGSTPGAKKGPYISQFLLIGTPDLSMDEITALESAQPVPNTSTPPAFLRLLRGQSNVETSAESFTDVRDLAVKDGVIRYGQQGINQRILPQLNGKDYMADWASWIDSQNGAELNGRDEFGYKVKQDDETLKDALPELGRFVHSPRDLATYVHFDQLYQAYHNAMLIMLGLGVSTDRGFPEGSGHAKRAAFATFGDPHILTLLPEVATRALKAVRRQKFQNHLRARPESLGGVLSLASHPGQDEKQRLGNALPLAESMLTELNSTDLTEWVKTHNANLIEDLPAYLKAEHEGSWINSSDNLLLAQAFPEGSPVHGSYGAGHATVAGACTTILKAFFEMYDVELDRGTVTLDQMINMAPTELFPANGDNKAIDLKTLSTEYYRTGDLEKPDSDPSTVNGDVAKYPGGALKSWSADGDEGRLSIEGELDKLAANISIGRNFAGVHYYTDYYESLRMGERIAVGMLQEQMLTYREPVSMRFTSFDGDKVMITGSGGSRGLNDAQIHVWEKGTNQKITNLDEWWNRCLREA